MVKTNSPIVNAIEGTIIVKVLRLGKDQGDIK
jgi:hypothetical protein